MKKYLYLRGHAPRDRDPKEIQYSSMEECDDVWIHLFHALTDGYGEVWYGGGKREFRYADNFVERYVRDFKQRPDFEPDVIFFRGGFPEYRHLYKAYPKAFKIYYGAGKRMIPKEKYDMVLLDSVRQAHAYPKGKLWIKPAAPHFKPVETEKKYDVCYVANGSQAEIKGIKWVYKTNPFKTLHLGNKSPYKPPRHIKTRRVLRKDMPAQISKCRVGIVPYTDYDSCPRVISEMLACGLPVVVLNTVNFWSNAYLMDDITLKRYGFVASKDEFWKKVKELIDSRPEGIRDFYERKLALRPAVERLRELVNGTDT